MEKPVGWLILAKCVENISRIVTFQVKMQVNYDARSFVCPLDTQPSGRDNSLQMFSKHFFLVENWLSIFLKNNTYSEKNWAYKYILKVNERHTRTRYELFPKSASKETIRTMSHRRCPATVFTANFEHYSYLVFVFLVLTLTSVQQYIKLEKKICCCFIFGLKNFDCFCKFLITLRTNFFWYQLQIVT